MTGMPGRGYDAFVAARRAALVAEARRAVHAGAGPTGDVDATAEAAVDRALARCRRRWDRLERTTNVEVHVRELVADELARPHRRRVTSYALLGLAAVLAPLVLLVVRPDPPAVRTEANPLPVPWYDGRDLHLADVVVTLPGVRVFQAVGDDVVVERADGSLDLVAADGGVTSYDDPFPAAPDVATGIAQQLPADARVVDAAVSADGVAVHLVNLTANRPEEGFLRQSATGLLVLLVCPTVRCETATTRDVPDRTLRLH